MTKKKEKDGPSNRIEAKARRMDILQFLVESPSSGRGVSFDQIQDRFGRRPNSTEETKGKSSKQVLQGDLNVLMELGLVDRPFRGTYRIIEPFSPGFNKTSAYGRRHQVQESAKELVAKGCIEHKTKQGVSLLGSRSCFISQGTSPEPLFKAFRSAKPDQIPFRIVTNSLPGFIELLGDDAIECSIIGGMPNLNSGAIIPVVDGDSLNNVNFDISVLSCSGIELDNEGGDHFYIRCLDTLGSFRAEVIKKQQTEIVILMDSTKFRRVPLGDKVNTEISFERAWIFVDDGEIEAKDDVKRLKEKLGDRFQRVVRQDGM